MLLEEFEPMDQLCYDCGPYESHRSRDDSVWNGFRDPPKRRRRRYWLTMLEEAIAEKKKITPRQATRVESVKYSPHLLEEPDFIKKVHQDIQNNIGYVFKGVVETKFIDRVVAYLKSIGRSSLPAYHPLAEGCPNFHRVIQHDKRASVKSIAHQFLFHPWNHDVFNIFEKMRPIYHLKNSIGGFDRDAFLDATPKDGHISRIAFIHYPRGGGMIKRHADPVGRHQLTVPVLQMSSKGEDYRTGGGYSVDEHGEVIDTDALMEKGDVLFFNAEVIHGVAPVDPDEELDWLSFRGRWSMLGSTIKTVVDRDTPSSIQLEP